MGYYSDDRRIGEVFREIAELPWEDDVAAYTPKLLDIILEMMGHNVGLAGIAVHHPLLIRMNKLVITGGHDSGFGQSMEAVYRANKDFGADHYLGDNFSSPFIPSDDVIASVEKLDRKPGLRELINGYRKIWSRSCLHIRPVNGALSHTVLTIAPGTGTVHEALATSERLIMFRVVVGIIWASLSRIWNLNSAPRLLSDTQREILYWVAQGKSTEEIGIILNRTPRSVGRSIDRAIAKMAVSNRTQAVVKAINIGELIIW